MFPTILRQLRLEQKLTQSKMAEALNISRVAYTNYELGNREPNFATITCIAHILGTTVDYLLGNSNMRTQKATASTAAAAKTDIVLPTPLHLIMLSAVGLSSESYNDLRKYIELLRIRDGVANRPTRGRFMQSTTEHPRAAHGKNNGINVSN